MHPLKTYIALFTLIVCFGCRPKIHEKAKEHFFVKQLFLKGGANISSAAYFNGKIFCLKDNDRLIVFDTSLMLDQNLTAEYSGIKIDFIRPVNDTILLSTDKDIYRLDSSFALKKSDWKPYNYGLPYFNDSTFYVYACSMGEMGWQRFFS